MVPIENSVEGGVTATLDRLVWPSPLQITAETVIPVSFNLCVSPGTTMADIRTVVSHPHAIAQVRDWLSENLPDANVVEKGSTAGAAAFVASKQASYGAICAPVAGDLYGLEAVATDIADNPSAATRFVSVTGPGSVPARTGHDKTTFMVYMREDYSGALLEILQQLAVHGVNLSRIESRPTKTTLGTYCFSIDAEGHIADARMRESLMGLKRVCKDVIFLGSYARADRREPAVPYGGRTRDYEAASRWFAQIAGVEYGSAASEGHRGH